MELNDIIARYMPTHDFVRSLSELFAGFAHDTRIRIISLLAIAPLNVGDISRVLGCNQTTISHQLRILKDRKIVFYQRQGKEIVYALNQERVNPLMLDAVEFLSPGKDKPGFPGGNSPFSR